MILTVIITGMYRNLGDNNLTGRIPSSLGDLAELEVLLVYNFNAVFVKHRILTFFLVAILKEHSSKTDSLALYHSRLESS
jgi:hypothetical protein